MYTRYLMAATAILLGGLGCGGDTASPVAPGAVAPATAAATTALDFRDISAGFHHTCGLTTGNRAYCWGDAPDGSVHLSPVAVPGGLRFRQISARLDYTCAVGMDYLVYCWGSRNNLGQLGDGTTLPHGVPAPVSGGHRFQQVAAGLDHTCAVSYHNGPIYCWGYNGRGEIGDGTTSLIRQHLTPVKVASDLVFKRVAVGAAHTCAVTTDNRAYCWGSNELGQLGDSSSAPLRTLPVRVSGNRRVRLISAGILHSCAVTTEGRAFCWGHGLDGELGNGKKYLSFWPRAVAGGGIFQQLTSGIWHNCAVTTDGQAYCWGLGGTGQLGDGDRNMEPRPVAVLGGLEFRQLAGGDEHSCGITVAGVGYCWGDNDEGTLGNGTTESSLEPVKIAGAK